MDTKQVKRHGMQGESEKFPSLREIKRENCNIF
jgi:hypothetical protein